MEVKCYNKKCGYQWVYQGENKKFICCPKCRFKRLLSKCRDFFLSKNDIPNDRPNDRPNDILLYKKEIVQPQTDKVEEGYYVEEQEPEEDPNTHFSELPTNLCDEHNLPATYDSLNKIWTCKKCIEIEVNKNINRPFKQCTDNLVEVTKLPPKIRILRTIPYNPLAALENN